MSPRRDRPTVDEARTLIAYHEQQLAKTASAERRRRSERAIARLRQLITEEEARQARAEGSR